VPSPPTGPTVKGTKKDGSPRVYVGKLAKTRQPTICEYLLTVAGPAHMSFRTAERFELVSFAELGTDRLRELEVHLDYFDAANEDAHGRLPHEPGYGSHLALVPEPTEANVVSLPQRPRRAAA
jgi:hypothetical protein